MYANEKSGKKETTNYVKELSRTWQLPLKVRLTYKSSFQNFYVLQNIAMHSQKL